MSAHLNMNADEWKQRGNKLYQANRYEEALTCYTNAIIKNPNDPAYFTNRALCYLNLKKWDSAADDCRKALEMDKKNVKANYSLGKVLFHFNQFDEAIKVLIRAHEASIHQRMSFGDEITQLIRTVRREKLRIDEEKRVNQEIELQSYLNLLIDDDIKRKIEEIRNHKVDRSEEATEDKIELVKNEGVSYKDQLNNLFSQVDDRRKKREIPDYLCGKISFELLKEPVITPSGITYDREDIHQHLQRVGHFDPVTRQPLTIDQLIPNFALREVLEHFVQENEWALDA